MRKILSSEEEIKGQWILDRGLVVEDANCQRIHWLINNHLIKAGEGNDGWRTLYLDPDDNRLWELSYPQAEMEGGGPPSIRWLSQEEALRKFPF
jgi:hypothetical protein